MDRIKIFYRCPSFARASALLQHSFIQPQVTKGDIIKKSIHIFVDKAFKCFKLCLLTLGFFGMTDMNMFLQLNLMTDFHIGGGSYDNMDIKLVSRH